MSIESAPDWAEGSGPGLPGTVRPNPAEFALFARAAARRYSGSFAGLPRVRRWQAWNEPNYFRHLSRSTTRPRKRAGRRAGSSPDIYRAMVNAFYAAIHGVHADNVVVAGAPRAVRRTRTPGRTWRARCRSCASCSACPHANRPLRRLRARVRFDVWAHHPYTSGGPTITTLATPRTSRSATCRR